MVCVLFWVTGVLEMTATENTIRFSGHTLDKATKAKVTLENYYSNLIAQHIERKQRYYMDSHNRII
jgi:serine/threonine kinase 38